ncbi:hypothetical protein R3P38DRAFT_3275156 [Favolaschia claudopus]|uniref:Uncharacterized protein n=1 Tax=Favolaschia claudopus TaxID=2862362 RepID=A0AAW0AXJ7_9AGAR
MAGSTDLQVANATAPKDGYLDNIRQSCTTTIHIYLAILLERAALTSPPALWRHAPRSGPCVGLYAPSASSDVYPLSANSSALSLSPFLFKHLSFDAGVDAFDFYMDKEYHICRLRSMHRTAVRLENLTESPLAFAPFVQSWTVTLGYQKQDKLDTTGVTGLSETLHTRIFAIFGKALTLCHNLSTVHLKRLKIDTMLLSTILSLPKLQHLTIDTRELTVADTGGVLPKTAMLRSLDLSDDYFLQEFAEIDLPILAHLTLRSVTGQGSFFQYVERFSRLETLTVISVQGPDFPVIKANSLPILRTLTGPPVMIISLAPNRPIARAFIGFTDAAAVLQTCAALSRSSVPVRTLDLPAIHFVPQLLPWQSNLHSINSMHEFLTEIATLLPDLTELALQLSNPHLGGWACGGCFSGINVNSEPLSDDELPILCDDTAFDDLPEHDISDDEGDASGLGTNITISLDKSPDKELQADSWLRQSFLQQISPSALPLPRNIEILHLQASWVGTPLPLAAQERALESLHMAYPTLQEVQLGLRRNSTWRRTGLSESFWRVVSNDC